MIHVARPPDFFLEGVEGLMPTDAIVPSYGTAMSEVRQSSVVRGNGEKVGRKATGNERVRRRQYRKREREMYPYSRVNTRDRIACGFRHVAVTV